jgi:hypothetical protein
VHYMACGMKGSGRLYNMPSFISALLLATFPSLRPKKPSPRFGRVSTHTTLGGLWSETLNTYGRFGDELASGLFYDW